MSVRKVGSSLLFRVVVAIILGSYYRIILPGMASPSFRHL